MRPKPREDCFYWVPSRWFARLRRSRGKLRENYFTASRNILLIDGNGAIRRFCSVKAIWNELQLGYCLRNTCYKIPLYYSSQNIYKMDNIYIKYTKSLNIFSGKYTRILRGVLDGIIWSFSYALLTCADNIFYCFQIIV